MIVTEKFCPCLLLLLYVLLHEYMDVQANFEKMETEERSEERGLSRAVVEEGGGKVTARGTGRLTETYSLGSQIVAGA